MGKLSKIYGRAHNSVSSDSEMARLLAKKSSSVKGFSKRDIVKGKIVKLTRSEILINIGGKALATVLEKDKHILSTILQTLKLGDEVSVSILNAESETGSPVVSLRRFMEERAWLAFSGFWKNQTQIRGTVSDVTKGGYILTIFSGMSGFLPYSFTLPNKQPSTGKPVDVYIIDLRQQEGKIILSQKRVLSDEEFVKAAKDYPVGQKIQATISAVTQFGIFVSLPLGSSDMNIDGLIHSGEIAWEQGDALSIYKVGETIDVVVIGHDLNTKRVDLSLKRLKTDPFASAIEKFPVDTTASGTVSKIAGGNVIVLLAEGVSGVIRKEKIPTDVEYKIGDKISVIVSDIDTRHRSINLLPVLLKKTIGYR